MPTPTAFGNRPQPFHSSRKLISRERLPPALGFLHPLSRVDRLWIDI